MPRVRCLLFCGCCDKNKGRAYRGPRLGDGLPVGVPAIWNYLEQSLRDHDAAHKRALTPPSRPLQHAPVLDPCARDGVELVQADKKFKLFARGHEGRRFSIARVWGHKELGHLVGHVKPQGGELVAVEGLPGHLGCAHSVPVPR